MTIKTMVYGLVLMSMIHISCVDQDPLGFSNKAIVGKYYLHEFETQRYSIMEKGLDSLEGPFEGTVLALGWDANTILANIDKAYDGDTDGWYALNIKSGTIIGPLNDDQIATDQLYSSLETYESHEVFKGLR